MDVKYHFTSIYLCVCLSVCQSIYLFFKEINTSFDKEALNWSKVIYSVTEDFYFKQMLFIWT